MARIKQVHPITKRVTLRFEKSDLGSVLFQSRHVFTPGDNSAWPREGQTAKNEENRQSERASSACAGMKSEAWLACHSVERITLGDLIQDKFAQSRAIRRIQSTGLAPCAIR